MVFWFSGMLSQMSNLEEKIARKSAHIAVVGLGYVGIPVAALFARADFPVLGFDINQEKIAKLRRGENPIKGKEPGLTELISSVIRNSRFRVTLDPDDLTDADIYFVCVETPIDTKTHKPDYTALKDALSTIGRYLKRGNMVIVESTIAPGTTDIIVGPILARASGLRPGYDFSLVHCPERLMPGQLLWKIEHHDRVVGGITKKSAKLAALLYRYIVKGRLDLTDAVTAEVVKTAENAYRDVQIAFANELALICEKVGADVYLVRELVNRSPHRDVHLPGAGVGGHCLPKDSWLLIAPVTKDRIGQLTVTARAVNDSMPAHIVTLATEGLREAGRPLKGATITVLGYSYLENTDDTRNSPSIQVVDLLCRRGANVRIHDPYVEPYSSPVKQAIQGSDCIIVMVAHDQYRTLKLADLNKWVKTPVLIDGRHVFGKKEARRYGFFYKGVGDI